VQQRKHGYRAICQRVPEDIDVSEELSRSGLAPTPDQLDQAKLRDAIIDLSQ